DEAVVVDPAAGEDRRRQDGAGDEELRAGSEARLDDELARGSAFVAEHILPSSEARTLELCLNYSGQEATATGDSGAARRAAARGAKPADRCRNSQPGRNKKGAEAPFSCTTVIVVDPLEKRAPEGARQLRSRLLLLEQVRDADVDLRGVGARADTARNRAAQAVGKEVVGGVVVVVEVGVVNTDVGVLRQR